MIYRPIWSNFKRSFEITLILCGINCYSPLYSLIRDYLIKLVSVIIFLILDHVFLTTSRSPFIIPLMRAHTINEARVCESLNRDEEIAWFADTKGEDHHRGKAIFVFRVLKRGRERENVSFFIKNGQGESVWELELRWRNFLIFRHRGRRSPPGGRQFLFLGF